MRFKSVHSVVAYLIAGIGMSAIAIGDVLHPALLVAAAIASIASIWAPTRLTATKAFQRAWTSVLAVIMVAEIIRVAFGASLIECGIELALLLQVGRLWNLREARHYQQVVVLSLVHLIAASVLDQGLSFALLFGAFVIAIPWAMTLSHLRREIEGNYRKDKPEAQKVHVDRVLNSRRIVGPRFLAATALLAIPVFLMSGLLFVFFPRIGLGFLASTPRNRVSVAGFSDEVELGDLGVVQNDQTVVMRVEVDPLPSPPPARLTTHWRGAAFDHYNGRMWTRTKALAGRQEVLRESSRYCLTNTCAVRGRRKTYSIYLEDLDPPVLVLPPSAEAVIMAPVRRGVWMTYRTLWRTGMSEIRREAAPTLVVHYEVEAHDPPEEAFLSGGERNLEPYLQLPVLDPLVTELAQRVTAGAAPDRRRMAEAVQRHLQAEYAYTLDLRGMSDERPLEDFLFRARAGHCEYFSTAMVIMLRTVGVPARNVTGFLGGRLNRFGPDGAYYTVSQSDAHSWVEVYVDGAGWLAFDPTPPGGASVGARGFGNVLRDLLDAARLSWEKNIIAYDLESQMDLLGSAWRASRGTRRGMMRNRQAPRASGAGRVGAIVAAGTISALALGWLVVWLVARRRRPGKGWRRPARPRLASAAALLKVLDRALVAAGMPRPAARTPREHVCLLDAAGHPAASEAGAVVERYNAVRFGGDHFREGEVRRLRSMARRVGRQKGGIESRQRENAP